jgi:hypothetical protein
MVVFKVLEVPCTVKVHIVLALTEPFPEGVFTVCVIDDFGALCLCVYGSCLHILPKGKDRGG